MTYVSAVDLVLPRQGLSKYRLCFPPILKGMKEGGEPESLTFPEFIVLNDFYPEPCTLHVLTHGFPREYLRFPGDGAFSLF